MPVLYGAGITADRTMTWPDADATVLTTHAAVTVAQGGTGLASLTAHALYVGNGASAPTALAVGATGTVLIGNTGADPSFSAAPSVTSLTASSFLAAGSSPAGTGVIRIPNNAGIYTKNASGSDKELIAWDGSDRIVLGDGGLVSVITGGANGVANIGATGARWGSGIFDTAVGVHDGTRFTAQLTPSTVTLGDSTGMGNVKGRSVVVANDGVVTLGTAALTGFVFVIDGTTDFASALYCFSGGSVSQEITDTSGIFTATAGTASSYNVYWNAGSSRFELENKRGGSRTVSVVYIGF